MTFHSRLQQSRLPRHDHTTKECGGARIADAQQVGWLLRQHLRFSRHWGRGWVWKEAPRPDRTWEERRQAPRPLEAYLMAAVYLAAHPSGVSLSLPLLEATGGQGCQLLLPPTLVGCREDVSACVERLFRAGAGLPAQVVHDAGTLLAEMAQNACDHSGSVGSVAVSWSPGRMRQQGLLCLGIVDAGVGIPRSVVRHCRERDLAVPAPGRSLQVALEADLWRQGPRGTGLCMSLARVDRYQGTFQLRSGGLVLSVGAGGAMVSSPCPRRFAAVPGTQICICLRSGKENRTRPEN